MMENSWEKKILDFMGKMDFREIFANISIKEMPENSLINKIITWIWGVFFPVNNLINNFNNNW